MNRPDKGQQEAAQQTTQVTAIGDATQTGNQGVSGDGEQHEKYHKAEQGFRNAIGYAESDLPNRLPIE